LTDFHRSSQIFVGINDWSPQANSQFSQFADSDDHADPPIAISGAIQSSDRITMSTIMFSLANKKDRLSEKNITHSESVDGIIVSLANETNKRTN
jgi:hypothetical protein